MKYYAVKNGRNPGVYMTWNECKEQVNGFSNARYKSFSTLSEAKEFVKLGVKLIHNNYITIYTDGSFANGKMGIGIHFPNSEHQDVSEYIPISNSTEFKNTNNIAELIAIERAIQMTNTNVKIFTDSSYCITSIIDGFYNENKSIIDRIKNLILMKKSNNITISIEKVKGHSDSIGNQKADQLATMATN